MSEPGWTFVGGGNIASPKVIPEYYVTDEDESVSQRTKSKNAEGESRSPAHSSEAQLALGSWPSFLLSRPSCFRESATPEALVSGNNPSRQLGE